MYDKKEYMKKWRLENRERLLEEKKKWFYAHRELSQKRALENRNKHEFDGKRESVLKRDNYICQICGLKENLVIHHKDGKGRRSEIKNNEMSNLITWCGSCHGKYHREHQLKENQSIKTSPVFLGRGSLF